MKKKIFLKAMKENIKDLEGEIDQIKNSLDDINVFIFAMEECIKNYEEE